MRKAKSLRNIIVVLVSNLKPGETVKIYEDPWTQKKLEGEAKLIERLQQDSDREYWLVEFTDSHERHPRWIKKKTEYERTSAQEKETARVNYARALASKVCIGLPAGETRNKCLREEFHKAYTMLLQRKEDHHSPEDKGDVTYPWKLPLQENLCERLEQFIMDEEKGISDYLGYINLMNEAFRHPEPAKVPEDLLRQLLVAVNRIVEEERSHVEMLKRIKERLCP